MAKIVPNLLILSATALSQATFGWDLSIASPSSLTSPIWDLSLVNKAVHTSPTWDLSLRSSARTALQSDPTWDLTVHTARITQ